MNSSRDSRAAVLAKFPQPPAALETIPPGDPLAVIAACPSGLRDTAAEMFAEAHFRAMRETDDEVLRCMQGKLKSTSETDDERE